MFPYFDDLKALNSFIDNRRPLPFAQALPGAPSFTLHSPDRLSYRLLRPAIGYDRSGSITSHCPLAFCSCNGVVGASGARW